MENGGKNNPFNAERGNGDPLKKCPPFIINEGHATQEKQLLI